MDRSSPNKIGYLLDSQIRDSYGKVLYTYTCHNIMENRFSFRDCCFNNAVIVLSAFTFGGVLTAVILKDIPLGNIISSMIGVVFSLIVLILNIYLKSSNLVDKANEHRKTADSLWEVKENYISLITDFETIELDEIIARRNELQEKTAEIYRNAPRTDKRAYKKAQKALKIEEEQTFSNIEIDNLLPTNLHRTKTDEGDKKCEN